MTLYPDNHYFIAKLIVLSFCMGVLVTILAYGVH